MYKILSSFFYSLAMTKKDISNRFIFFTTSWFIKILT
jgi:hypothetical protein